MRNALVPLNEHITNMDVLNGLAGLPLQLGGARMVVGLPGQTGLVCRQGAGGTVGQALGQVGWQAGQGDTLWWSRWVGVQGGLRAMVLQKKEFSGANFCKH